MTEPIIVTLCGSTRFPDAFIKAMKDETLAGKMVFTVGLFGHLENLDMTGPTKKMLDELHFAKIRHSQEILVFNVLQPYCKKCNTFLKYGEKLYFENCCGEKTIMKGYIGQSTRNEINYAISLGKKVRYLNPVE